MSRMFDTLIIGDGSGIADGNIFFHIDSIHSVFSFLSKLPVEYVLKRHPLPIIYEHKDIYDLLFPDCEELAEYIPVEFYFQFVANNVISICSYSLIFVSIFPDLKAISLLELVDWKDESYKNKIKTDMLAKSKNNIQFPSDLEMLEKLIMEGRKNELVCNDIEGAI